MGASAADTPTRPESLRASDAERDRAVDELRKEFVEGRLSHDTFMARMQTAFGARSRGQLADLFTDLPRRPGPAKLLARAREALRGAGLQPRAGQVRWPEPAPVQRLTFPPGSGATFTIGRTHECDLRIPDMSVSRLHASLAREPGGWVLTDLGSRNGTRLNGWRIREPVPVRAGDRVEFGAAAFVFAADPRQPPPG